jgi:hypothetical protein
MKYVLLFAGTMSAEDRAADPELADQYKRTEKWFEENVRTGKVIGGEELKGPETATTVRFKAGKPMVTDGPFIESKEIIGGFALVDVTDLDEALELARTWPGGDVEVRPVVEHLRP